MKPCRILQVALLLAVFVASSGQRGCVTTGQGQALQTDLDSVKIRIDELETKHTALADSIGTSNSAAANVVADFDEVRAEMQQLRGKIEDMEFGLTRRGGKDQEALQSLEAVLRQMDARIGKIEEKLGIESPAAPLTGGEEPAATDKDLYEQAYGVYKAGRVEEAKSKFRAFLKEHPGSRYAANAQFWLGECYYDQEDYENAILEFDKVIIGYPSSQKVAPAYLKMGYCFLKMGETADAKLFFNKVVSDFPDTEQAEIARRKLKQLP